MLNKFRNCYPHGSLTSDLVKIDRCSYIVKASVKVNDTVLATGLAAASTVEEAEDRARSRALALIDLNLPSKIDKNISKPVVNSNFEDLDKSEEIHGENPNRDQTINHKINTIPSPSSSQPPSSSSSVEENSRKQVSSPILTESFSPLEDSLVEQKGVSPTKLESLTPTQDNSPPGESSPILTESFSPRDSREFIDSMDSRDSIEPIEVNSYFQESESNLRDSLTSTEDNSSPKESFPKLEESLTSTYGNLPETEELSDLRESSLPSTHENLSEEEKLSDLTVTENKSSNFDNSFSQAQENNNLDSPELIENDHHNLNSPTNSTISTNDFDLNENSNLESYSESNLENDLNSLTSPETIDISNKPVYDFTEIMARTDGEMKRLGWTKEDGINYLLKTYGKKSRHLLNDEELIKFLEHLKNL